MPVTVEVTREVPVTEIVEIPVTVIMPEMVEVPVTIEVTREIPVTQVFEVPVTVVVPQTVEVPVTVEVTREVPVTQFVPVTVPFPVTQIVPQTVPVPVEVPVEVPVTVPVPVTVEVTREIIVTQIVPQTVEVPVTVLVPAEPPPEVIPITLLPVIPVVPLPVSPLQVTRVTSIYDQPNNLWYFVGEVVNQGEAGYHNIEVKLDLLDDAGNVVGTQTTSADVPYLRPQEASPFVVAFQSAPAWTRFQASAQGEPIPEGVVYPFLASGDDKAGFDRAAGGFVVTGMLGNVGNTVAQRPKVSVIVLSADERVIGYGSTFLETAVLNPGERAPFMVTVGLTTGEEIASYRLYAGAMPQR
ncbi:MAG: FxLYD domain-containing protein [Anaerolineae bacterium]|nr:FxLYD domain-containing protein [Anaerolineae bacterium]